MRRSCVVTGAASGLGRATAGHLAQKGWEVFGLDLPGKYGTIDEVPFHALEGDILDEDSVRRAFALATASTDLCGVVHCAGVAYAGTTLGRLGPHPNDTFEWVLRTNVAGTFQIARLGAEAMAGQPNDAATLDKCIILTSSVAAMDGQRGQVAYAASKGAVASMVLPMARDLARNGIRVVGVAPGVFKTNMMALLPQEKQEALGNLALTPKRLGNPEEFAQLISHILDSTYMNGTVVRLDGGIRLP